MEIDKIYAFKEMLKTEGILYCYSGLFTQGIIEEISEILKHKIEHDTQNINITQKIVTIFIEQVQNVLIHCDDKIFDNCKDKGYPTGIVTIGVLNDAYYIICGNTIDIMKKPGLTNKITYLNSLDKESLKNLYKEKLKGPRPEESKGAGLGFIEIARKSNQPIEYHFHDLDKQHTFFTIKVTVNI